MKIIPFILAIAPLASGFTALPVGRVATKLDATIFFDSQTGNTEKCAGYLGEASGVPVEFIGEYSRRQRMHHEKIQLERNA